MNIADENLICSIWPPDSPQAFAGNSSEVISNSLVSHEAVLTFWQEHLGLIPPQDVNGANEKITSFMMPAPILNEDESELEEDRIVADPLSDELHNLWNKTATH